jgi:hypothetical protein
MARSQKISVKVISSDNEEGSDEMTLKAMRRKNPHPPAPLLTPFTQETEAKSK